MDKKSYKDMWVYIEHDGTAVHPVALELCCEVRKLCDQSGDRLIAVIAGTLPEAEIERVRACGVDGVIQVSGTGYERYNTEAYTNLFTVLCQKYNPSAEFVGGTTNGRDFAPRFAARLETGCTSDATELIYNPETTDIEFVEPAAGGKIMAVITIPELRPQVGTIRPGTFKYIPTGKKAEISVIHEEISFPVEDIRTKFLGFAADAFDPELDIASCETIVCVGAGLKDESLEKYRELAKLLGMPEDNVVIAEIGDVIELDQNKLDVTGVVPNGSVLIDGLGVGDVGAVVLRDRKHLAEDGLLIVVMGVDHDLGTVVSGPDIISRGFVYMREADELIDGAREAATRAIEAFGPIDSSEWSHLKNDVRDSVQRYIYDTIKRNPMIMPIIVEI